MQNITRVRAAFRIVLLVLIAATLVFIFANSLKSAEESSKDSAAVGGLLSSLFPPDTPLGAFIKDNLRKLAHFTEFGLLGAEIAVYVYFFTQDRRRWATLSPIVGLVVGFIDETLQYIPDRGPEISDVWIDLGGFVTLSLVAYGAILTVRLVARAIRERQLEKENG